MSRRAAYRILILGGYGHFGARIATALAGSKESQIVIAGRDLAAARAMAAKLARRSRASHRSSSPAN